MLSLYLLLINNLIIKLPWNKMYISNNLKTTYNKNDALEFYLTKKNNLTFLIADKKYFNFEDDCLSLNDTGSPLLIFYKKNKVRILFDNKFVKYDDKKDCLTVKGSENISDISFRFLKNREKIYSKNNDRLLKFGEWFLIRCFISCLTGLPQEDNLYHIT